MKPNSFLLLSLSLMPLPATATSVEHLESIIVTAEQINPETENPPVALRLDEESLRMKVGHSIGETLKDELGISSQSFGPGVGTPVIRGQAGPRVRVMSNGIGSNDMSTLSPDHPSSSEAMSADSIEVLRGPATLLYSSGAMGGVVNVIDNRIPEHLTDRAISGAFEQRFDSTSDETSSMLKLDGNGAHLAYHLDGLYRQRDNLGIAGQAIDSAKVAITDPALDVVDNPTGYLDNTGAEAISGSAGLSWIDDFGFAGAAISNLNNSYGIAPDGSGHELVQIAMRQNKYDFKSELAAPLPLLQKIKTRLGYTDYQHSEIANGKTGALFTRQSYEGRLELIHQDFGRLHGLIGFQAQASDYLGLHYHNHEHEHEEAAEHDEEAALIETIIPASEVRQYSVFALETLDDGPLSYQFGLRIEQTDIQTENHAGFNYTPVSASVAALWQIDARQRINLSLTRSSRAPQVQELLSDGFHHATRAWERGNTDLREETTYNLELGYRFQSDWLRAELDLFHNWAGDYIFQRRSGEFVDEEGSSDCGTACVPVLVSSQSDAVFKGYEAKLIVPLMENRHGLLELTLFSDYTRGEFKSGGDVPRMPPLRYGLQLDYAQDRLNAFLRFTRAEDQAHSGEFETSTAGYFLLNTGLNYQIDTGSDSRLLLFAKGNNLLNQNIRNATSYLRNFAPEAGRGAEIGFRLSY